jgi:F-type H+-transporting ATPase subunit epsilon
VRLRILTPSGMAVDASDVRYLRAEDSTGVFGLQPGHTEFMTVLTVSVMTWRDAAERNHHVAVRGGVLRVHGGAGMLVEIATREAIVGESLEDLERVVLARFRETAQAEARARTSATQLHASVVRSLYRFVRAERGGGSLALGTMDREEAP